MIALVPEQTPPAFREYKFVRQEPGGRRRWFESHDLELVVWYDQAGAQLGFQLHYWLADGEHALTWQPNRGFNHHRVDAGDESPFKNESPVLQPAGHAPWSYLKDAFQQRATSLEPPLRDGILSVLQAGA
jgi:hypothetical protein